MKFRRLFRALIAVSISFLMISSENIVLSAKECNYNLVDYECLEQVVDQSNWMSYLKDNTLISQMTIPGSHDSGAIRCVGLVPGFAQAQSLFIDEQLTDGIRAFDLRYVYIYKNFYIYHGYDTQIGYTYRCYDKTGLKLSLEKCLKYMKSFLEAHPQEVVFVNFQKEGGNDYPVELANVLNSYNVYLMTEENMNSLTIGELRGRIVDASICIGHASGDYNDWTASRTMKVEQLTNVFNNAQSVYGNPTLKTTYASICYRSAVIYDPYEELSGLEIYTVKQQANYLYENFWQNYTLENNKAYGFVMMDFVKSDVIERLIQINDFAK